MRNNCTERTRKIVAIAKQEAERCKSPSIQPEHLLYGVLKEGGGVAAAALRKLGVSLHGLRGVIWKSFEIAMEGAPDPIPFSPESKKAFAKAEEYSGRMGFDYIGTEYLFLALLENAGIAELLKKAGVEKGKARDKVFEILGLDVTSDLEGRSDPMFENFTERARKAMTLGRNEAQRLNSEFLGTEHMLLGIIHEGGGVAAKVLKALKVNLKTVVEEIHKIITPSTHPTVTMGLLPLSSRAKKACELSNEEACRVDPPIIGTAQLLLGLIKEEHGIAFQVLKNFGVDLDNARREVDKYEKTARAEGVRPLVGDDDKPEVRARIRLFQKVGGSQGHDPRVLFVGPETFLEGETITISGVDRNRLQSIAAVVAKEAGTEAFILEIL